MIPNTVKGFIESVQNANPHISIDVTMGEKCLIDRMEMKFKVKNYKTNLEEKFNFYFPIDAIVDRNELERFTNFIKIGEQND